MGKRRRSIKKYKSVKRFKNKKKKYVSNRQVVQPGWVKTWKSRPILVRKPWRTDDITFKHLGIKKTSPLYFPKQKGLPIPNINDEDLQDNDDEMEDVQYEIPVSYSIHEMNRPDFDQQFQKESAQRMFYDIYHEGVPVSEVVRRYQSTRQGQNITNPFLFYVLLLFFFFFVPPIPRFLIYAVDLGKGLNDPVPPIFLDTYAIHCALVRGISTISNDITQSATRDLVTPHKFDSFVIYVLNISIVCLTFSSCLASSNAKAEG